MRGVDSRVGIVRRVEAVALPPDMPAALRVVQAYPADWAAWCSWPSEPTCAGGTFWDAAAARAAAHGEVVERYCGGVPAGEWTTGSYRRLARTGRTALDPSRLALYSDEQYRMEGFPFVPFDGDLEVRWVRGHDLAGSGPVLVPASLVWHTYPRLAEALGEPRTNATNYAGMASGASLRAAQWSGLLEVLERDAVTLAWLSGAPLARLVVPSWLDDLGRGSHGGFRAVFVAFPSLSGLPVIGAVVVHEETEHVAVGTACRPDPVDAALKALAEAFQLHLAVRQLDDPESPLCRLARTRPGPLKPWRRDRGYRHSYRSDLGDVTDLACHLQLHLDRTVQAELWGSVTDGAPMRLEDIEARAPDLGAVVECLARHGARAAVVDLTTPDVRSLGMHVVRVVAAGTYSNAAAAFPPLGGERMAAALAAVGGRHRVLPLPFA